MHGLIERMSPRGRYMVSSGNSLATYCLEANRLAMEKAVAEFGRYSIAV